MKGEKFLRAENHPICHSEAIAEEFLRFSRRLLSDCFCKSEPAEATQHDASMLQAYARGGSGLPGSAGLRRKSSGGHKLKKYNHDRRPNKTHCVGGP